MLHYLRYEGRSVGGGEGVGVEDGAWARRRGMGANSPRTGRQLSSLRWRTRLVIPGHVPQQTHTDPH